MHWMSELVGQRVSDRRTIDRESPRHDDELVSVAERRGRRDATSEKKLLSVIWTQGEAVYLCEGLDRH